MLTSHVVARVRRQIVGMVISLVICRVLKRDEIYSSLERFVRHEGKLKGRSIALSCQMC